MLTRLLKSIGQKLVELAHSPTQARDASAITERAVERWDLGDLAGAEQLLREAIRNHPSYGRAHSNLGMVLLGLQKYDEGMAQLWKATAVDPGYAGARVNLGIALYMSGSIEQSVEQYRAALAIDPALPQARFNLLMALLDTCNWDAAEAETRTILEQWRAAPGEKVYDCVSPFVSLLLQVPQEFRLQVAQHAARQVAKRIAGAQSPRRPPSGRRDRLRIGYLSSDFRNHATSYLVAGLIEQHDRGRHEILAYSSGADDGSECRRRLAGSFDRFIDISDVSHSAAARRIAEDEVDILVDLNGYTQGARSEIAALRPAPVQVNFLGYPGTMGADFIDYIVADRTVLPQDDARYYSEKIVWMPATYQANDNRQRISDAAMRRSDHGLPDGFVFCSFNKHCKVERSRFDSWLRILAATPGSVLWLQDGPGAPRLRERARLNGVDPDRLVFAKVIPKPDYLARFRLADLFLDTETYNAHTIASDALWAGIPVLTCPSPGFAGKVASSLLRAINLPELIAEDVGAYERLAIALARDPAALHNFRTRLNENRLTQPLFDTPRFARDLERAYATMWERHLSGDAPRSFSIE